MSIMIFLALIVLLVVQLIILKRNSSKFQLNEDEAKISELLEAIHSGKQQHTDKRGRTILMIACDERPIHKSSREGFFRVIQESLKTGIRVNARSLENGKTALAYAAAKPYNTDVVEYLIKTGADTSSKDSRGRTPLFEAATYGDLSVFSAVANHTSNLNVTDDEGNTPLMSAVAQMNLPVIHELIERNANVKLRNNKGESAYDIAARVKPKFTKYSRNSARPNEYGKHNHTLDEMVRELHCLENDEPFKPKKYVPPSTGTLGDTGDLDD
ncbi:MULTISPECIES: ankyrin repeat domain-containing protein [unclassified Fusibacter]|uniref:ankyrin repeat domain-containing protein n=1 Tax=unclassified Fusibacter TaxID=2624464 RepID=UPI001012360D|nr:MULTISPECIES: ankyrin repeat domain-containing protein [unclassified Fusibacter]MCK8060237.1 ankyrin repeat domain-containing protein [Fusibacter sp. A2]NPE22376.1 hypothetical protein [Fusibacter sp. A1]RXV61148.1 ankyrin repeat domain-containing protein [Fusibacter sp. A1]